MKTIWKILTTILIILTILLIIAATTPPQTAVDINNLKLPTDWEARGDGNYVETIKLGQHFSISKTDNNTIKDFKTNDTDYTVTDISHNNTMYEYSDTSDYCVFEVVQINNTDYMIVYSCSFERMDELGPDELWGSDVLKEVNKLNGFEPIPI